VLRRQHHGSREDLVAYVLSARPGTPTAVIATVGSQHNPATGLPRAIRQATKLDVPLAYATNGKALVEHFIASGQTRQVETLASPLRAWRSYLRLHRLRRAGAHMVSQTFDTSVLSDADRPVELRYYQIVATNRALSALSRDQRRVLLQLVPGSGTTVVATALMAKFASYQLQARPGQPCGLLYLDDRPLAESSAQTLGPVRRLAQTTAADLTIGSLGDEFDQLDPADIDLVVVNLAHGGQTADPAIWTGVLERFPNAYQVGIVGVAQPAARSVYEYFGRPVYRYTAEQARSDGYMSRPPAGVANPADSGPDDFDVAAIVAESWQPAGESGASCSAWGPGSADSAVRSVSTATVRSASGAGAPSDPVAVAVQIRRSVEYANLEAGQAALAAELVSLLQMAKRPGAVGRAARRQAEQLTELEILAELEDQVGGEEAILRHIALLKDLLASR
jgi:hypothetical protein